MPCIGDSATQPVFNIFDELARLTVSSGALLGGMLFQNYGGQAVFVGTIGCVCLSLSLLLWRSSHDAAEHAISSREDAVELIAVKK